MILNLNIEFEFLNFLQFNFLELACFGQVYRILCNFKQLRAKTQFF